MINAKGTKTSIKAIPTVMELGIKDVSVCWKELLKIVLGGTLYAAYK